ncbi:MAG TPA: hypothetical protein VKN76_03270, partial [Kiloniellaceae bacterium]|nr:hypothetical protein [Kiloniellaceae bacterium]
MESNTPRRIVNLTVREKVMRSRKIAQVVFGAAVALFVGAGAAGADDLRWKMPIAFGSNLPGLGSPAPWVADTLTKTSGGSIQVRVYEPGELVPPFDILQS